MDKKKLLPIKFNLNEKQFTQLSFDNCSNKYVISAFFRKTGKFTKIYYKNPIRARQFYREIIKDNL